MKDDNGGCFFSENIFASKIFTKSMESVSPQCRCLLSLLVASFSFPARKKSLGFEGYMEGTELDLDLDGQKGTIRKQLDFHHKHHLRAENI